MKRVSKGDVVYVVLPYEQWDGSKGLIRKVEVLRYDHRVDEIQAINGVFYNEWYEFLDEAAKKAYDRLERERERLKKAEVWLDSLK